MHRYANSLEHPDNAASRVVHLNRLPDGRGNVMDQLVQRSRLVAK